MAVTPSNSSFELIRDSRRVIALLRGSRQEILRELREPDSASGLSRRMGVPRQRLNYHLRQMEKEGLVELVEERRRGNCVERVVRPTARAFVVSPEALGSLPAGAEKELDRASASFQIATAARVLREVAELDQSARDAGRRLVTLTLDTEIRFASAQERNSFAAELADALADLLRKYHDPEGEIGLANRLTTLLHPVPPPASGTPPAEAKAEVEAARSSAAG